MYGQLLALAVLAILLVPCPGEAQDKVPGPRGRPLIIFIHGRNQQVKAPDELRHEWFSSFKSGLQTLSERPPIKTSDYMLVSYQLLYREHARVVCPGDEKRRQQRLGPVRNRQQAAAKQLAKAKTRLDAADQDVENATNLFKRGFPPSTRAKEEVERARGDYQRAQSAYEAAATEDAEAREALIDEIAELNEEEANERSWYRERFLAAYDSLRVALIATFGPSKQMQDLVLRYLHDAELYITNRVYRCATNAELARALSAARHAGRPVILVGHSMGALVVYDLLHTAEAGDPLGTSGLPFDVRRFVSLGTQLGVERFMANFLGGIKPRFPVPASIHGWLNLRGQSDHVSPATLGSHYDFSGISFAEFQIPTEAGAPHDVIGYLSNKATASAIAFAWCRAFEGRKAPRHCDRVRDAAAGDGGAIPAR